MSVEELQSTIRNISGMLLLFSLFDLIVRFVLWFCGLVATAPPTPVDAPIPADPPENFELASVGARKIFGRAGVAFRVEIRARESWGWVWK